MKMTFAELSPPATDEECRLWPTAHLVHKARKRAERAARLDARPSRRLRALAYQRPGASLLLTEYQRGKQCSSLLVATNKATGAEFSTHIVRSLVDDSVAGVRVTLIKRATRGSAPEVTKIVTPS